MKEQIIAVNDQLVKEPPRQEERQREARELPSDDLPPRNREARELPGFEGVIVEEQNQADKKSNIVWVVAIIGMVLVGTYLWRKM